MNICSKSQFWSVTESKDDLNQQNGASLIHVATEPTGLGTITVN